MNIDIVYVLYFLAAFLILSYGGSWLFSRNYNSTKSQFLLADRKLGFWESSFSIAASWIWAPSLFVSAFQAYTNGWVGLFWFAVPNFLALILFALLINKVVNRFPQGYSLSEFMAKKYSNRVQSLYWISLIGLTVGAFATQVLAGAKFISMITGMDYFWASVIIVAIPLSYSLYFGLKSSVITDFAKILVLYTIGIVIVPWTIIEVGGWQVVADGLYGVSKQFTSLFDSNGWLVFATFGLPTAIGLLSGPFGDQAFWQRGFSTNGQYRRKAFLLAAVLFIVVPLGMGMLGFAAAGLEFAAKSKQFVNLELVAMALGTIGICLFSIIVLSSVTSILDSKLCAVSSITGHDFCNRFGLTDSLMVSRVSMIILAVVSLLIANIPKLELVHLFLIYGALRASTLLPTLLTILSEKPMSEKGMFWGILISIAVFLPIFAYGLLNKIPEITIAGSLGGVLISGIIVYLSSVMGKRIENKM